MVDAEREVGGGNSGGICVKSGVVRDRVVAKANGVLNDSKTGSSGSGGSLVTYKRRKITKAVEDGRISDDSANQFEKNVQSEMHSFDEASHKRSHDPPIASHGCPVENHRDIVLKQICQSLESESGLVNCIRSAIAFQSGNCSRNAFKESVRSRESRSRCTFQTVSAHEDLQNAAKASTGRTSNGSVNEPDNDTVTELCRTTFSDIIKSEKFAELCSLLLQNFQGVKVNRVFDLSLICSRMQEKVYETKPVLFHADIQQIWTKLQKVGTDMIALAKCLSDKTSTSFREQVGGLGYSIPEDGRNELPEQESDLRAKVELTEGCALDEAHACRHCGEKADGRNALVCDSCEEMYHISCIEPAVKEIPSRSWYCALCTAKGIESPHVHCVACERLNTSRSTFDGNEEDELGCEESPAELEGSSSEAAANEEGKRFPLCTVCRTEVGNDEDYRICGHCFCPHKFYHVRCLTNKQLISYGPCWYCPSCLCRTCFTDRDDDKIVLCDGCDHAYHIYCMQPPLTAIPEGKWFCKKCDSGIQRIQKAKNSYENMHNKSRKVPVDGNLKGKETLDKSGGVDMLLNAAKALM